MDAHGKNDIKDGIVVNGRIAGPTLVFPCQPVARLRACSADKEITMLKLGLLVRLEAKAGKEREVVEFLNNGLALANQEPMTATWFALRLGPTTFAIFDAFAEETGRQHHLSGPIAQALMANAPALLASPPTIERVEVLGAKLPAETLTHVK
jgi:quinol monooxygenase YgiN